MKPIGVQLYSLRSLAQDDFVSVLKKVADIGYKYVEPAGLWNLRPREFKKIIADLGLEMISFSFSFKVLQKASRLFFALPIAPTKELSSLLLSSPLNFLRFSNCVLFFCFKFSFSNIITPL